ncbi:MAG: hypothetical protein QOF51_4187 [Chloroflexota bacterium]|nr:hypothetical protein [Chloroflexota bacterium]
MPTTPAIAPDQPTGLLGTITRFRTFEALRYREFRLLWMGQFGSAMGMWMDQVTRGWLIYELTGSALQLGLISAIRFFPLLFLSPLAGTMADRYGRKTQLILDQMSNAAINFLLGVLVISGHVQPWHVYATGFVAAILGVFQQPARQAMVPEAVDRAHLTNAIGLNSMVFNASRSIGPAVSGAIIFFVGTGGSYIVQGFIYLFASQWTWQLRLPNRPPSRATGVNARSTSLLASAIQGWRYILHDPIIRSGMIVAMIPAFMGMPFTALLPVFARDVLAVGSQGQGLLLTFMGIGALSSAILIATVGDRLPKGKLMTAGMTLYGAAMIVFSHSFWFPLSLSMMFITGLCNVTSNALVQTVVQAHSPPELRGRIMGVFQQNQLLINLGALLAGSFATWWGAQVAVEIMGIGLVTTSIAAFFAFPTIRTLR